MCIQIVFPILHEITPAVSNTCLLLRIKVQADGAGCGQWSRTPQELHSGVHRGWVGGRPQGFSQDLHRVSEWQPAPGGNRHLQQGQVGTHALFSLFSFPLPFLSFGCGVSNSYSDDSWHRWQCLSALCSRACVCVFVLLCFCVFWVWCVCDFIFIFFWKLKCTLPGVRG